jgi:hypothetical protein
MTDVNEQDPEITAMGSVYAALRDLDRDAQVRVLSWASQKLGIKFKNESNNSEIRKAMGPNDDSINHETTEDKDDESDDLDEISPVAKKWMIRNGLDAKSLSIVYSLGVGEIDLVAKTVPGKSKREKMHSVFLLQGIAAYLSNGAPRFTHEQMKETCLHYDAFDATNFASNFKSLLGDVSGSKDTGYVLTARGLANATELIKTMTQQPS